MLIINKITPSRTHTCQVTEKGGHKKFRKLAPPKSCVCHLEHVCSEVEIFVRKILKNVLRKMAKCTVFSVEKGESCSTQIAHSVQLV